MERIGAALMDGYQVQVDESADAPPQADVAAAIGTDERRMHVRAYNHWASLLHGRDYPSIEDLDPSNIHDFAPHSVLLDFTADPQDPATSYIGAAIRDECDLGADVQHISDVPARSLLSRLTDHYMQIIANRAPIGFEAEFVNQRGHEICYRGILMPFSSDGDTIDFIYGVINWKDTSAEPRQAPAALQQAEPEGELVLAPEDALGASFVAGEGSDADEVPLELSDILTEEAGLADRLWAARETAEVLKEHDGRSRAALYRALSMAYDFAVATRSRPDEYSEILEDAGVKAQARAPMTPIVKLVFGVEYDKTRLTEFAAALSYAERCDVDFEGFLPFIEGHPGGLKGLVAAERDARRPEPRPDTRLEAGRTKLRAASPRPLSALAGNDEFTLILVRRSDDGSVEPVSAVSDLSMLEKAIRKHAA